MNRPYGDKIEQRRAGSGDVDDHRDWFERLYVMAGDGEAEVPWDRGTPHPLFEDWGRQRSGETGETGGTGEIGAGRRALVVGCGLGNDAEYAAELGFRTTAFDFAETAIREARSRFPDSAVEYHVADLLNPPPEWRAAFDFVLESLTVQSLPRSFRSEAIGRVRDFVAPGGTLLVIAGMLRDGDEDAAEGPWRLTRSDIDSFATDGLELVRLEQFSDGDVHRWRAELVRA
jgi:SAM-dependent methyltransferase